MAWRFRFLRTWNSHDLAEMRRCAARLMGRTDPILPEATAPRQPDLETSGCVVVSARRCRVRHGGFAPAGETKLGDQWRIPMISRCGRVCRRAGFGASFDCAGGPRSAAREHGSDCRSTGREVSRCAAPAPAPSVFGCGVRGSRTILGQLFVDEPRAGGLF